jgi:ANTAR domain
MNAHHWRPSSLRRLMLNRGSQTKGVLHAELGVSPEEAFGLLSRYSQNTNQRVRKISARLVQGRITAAEFRPSHGRTHPG